jgi:hypothetical protein
MPGRSTRVIDHTVRDGLTRTSHQTNLLLRALEQETKVLPLDKEQAQVLSKTIKDLKLVADLVPQTLDTPLETISLELLLNLSSNRTTAKILL